MRDGVFTPSVVLKIQKFLRGDEKRRRMKSPSLSQPERMAGMTWRKV